MPSTTFSIRMDADIKKQLDDFCSKMGISTNAAFNLFANTVVREKRIPFEIADNETLHHQWILEQIGQAQKEAKDPNTRFLTMDEVFSKFRKKYNYEI